jgi:hypothetical protein
MSALSLANQSFSTFHSNTTAIPPEITSQIIEYAIPDTQLLPMGGGVDMRRAHQPVASVSCTLRMIYLGLPYPTTTKHKATTPVHLNIGEALYFNDLRTLAAFFREGPGRDTALLHKVRFLGQLSLSIETISRLGSSNTNGLTLSTSTYTIERQSPRDVSSSEPHITSGEDVGLCYPSEGRRGATLNLPHPAHHLIPRTARSHTYLHKGERHWIRFCYWEVIRKLCQNFEAIEFSVRID